MGTSKKSGTSERREIYALDFAVCQVIVTIDETLRPVHNLGWRALGQTFNYEVQNQDHNRHDDSPDKTVFIHPVGWPETSYIACRIYVQGQEWSVEGGSIWAGHLRKFNHAVFFKFHKGCPSFITPRGTGGINEKIREAARLRRPDLVGNPRFDL